MAAQQSFGTFVLAFMLCVAMYMIIALWNKLEKKNEQLLAAYRDRDNTAQHLAILTQHLHNKNYDFIEQQLLSIKRKEEPSNGY